MGVDGGFKMLSCSSGTATGCRWRTNQIQWSVFWKRKGVPNPKPSVALRRTLLSRFHRREPAAEQPLMCQSGAFTCCSWPRGASSSIRSRLHLWPTLSWFPSHLLPAPPLSLLWWTCWTCRPPAVLLPPAGLLRSEDQSSHFISLHLHSPLHPQAPGSILVKSLQTPWRLGSLRFFRSLL